MVDSSGGNSGSFDRTTRKARARDQGRTPDAGSTTYRSLPPADSTVVSLADFQADFCSAERHNTSRSSLFPQQSATVISFEGSRKYLSSIEIDGMTDILMQYSNSAIEKMISEVGRLLRREFGTRLVRREKRVFTVTHDDFECLVAGILRVQFHTHRLALPEYNVFGEKTDLSGITLTWGIGHSNQQAEGDRLKKRRQKLRHKSLPGRY